MRVWFLRSVELVNSLVMGEEADVTGDLVALAEGLQVPSRQQSTKFSQLNWVNYTRSFFFCWKVTKP